MIRVTVPRPVAEALMDGSLRLLVVEDAGHNWSYPPPDIVRAIEAGERIGIDVECECGGTGQIEAEYWDLTDPNNHLGWVPCDCTAGLVPVGSVRPVRVLPIVHWSDNDEESPSCISVGHDDGRAFAAIGFSHNEVDLSVYGTAESLVGKFAVEVEEAQRA